MGASDAGIILIMQRVIRNVALMDIVPDLLRSPIHNGIDFYQPKLCVPFNFLCVRASRSLIATNTRNPRAQPRQLSPQWFNLAQFAASVRIARPKGWSMNSLLTFWRKQSIGPFYLNVVPLFDSIRQIVSLWEQKLGIECEHTKVRPQAGSHIDQDHSFRSECGRDSNVSTKPLESPAQHLFRSPILRQKLNARQFVSHAASLSAKGRRGNSGKNAES